MVNGASMSLSPRLILVVGLCLLSPGGNARAENYDLGKSGAKLFAANCSACHRSPRGLAKNRLSWTLTSFLQQHYTSSRASAQELSNYLLMAGGGTRTPKSGATRARTTPPKGSSAGVAPRPPASIPNQ
jgi:hypothetical protein